MHPKRMKTKEVNRLKAVLIEKGRSGKWLGDKLGKDTSTVSKWCTNSSQPSIETLLTIADLLGVDIHDLLNKSK